MNSRTQETKLHRCESMVWEIRASILVDLFVILLFPFLKKQKLPYESGCLNVIRKSENCSRARFKG